MTQLERILCRDLAHLRYQRIRTRWCRSTRFVCHGHKQGPAAEGRNHASYLASPRDAFATTAGPIRETRCPSLGGGDQFRSTPKNRGKGCSVRPSALHFVEYQQLPSALISSADATGFNIGLPTHRGRPHAFHRFGDSPRPYPGRRIDDAAGSSRGVKSHVERRRGKPYTIFQRAPRPRAGLGCSAGPACNQCTILLRRAGQLEGEFSAFSFWLVAAV